LDIEILAKEAQVLQERAKAKAQDWTKLGKALEALRGEAGWLDPKARKKVFDLASKLVDGEASDAGRDLRTFVASAKAGYAALRPMLRSRLIEGLEERAKKEGIAFEILGETPVVLRYGDLSLNLDFEKELATWTYAREKLASCPLVLEQILEIRREVLAALQGSWPGREAFFEALFAAWGAAVGRAGLPPGSRVELVQLLPEMGVEMQGRGLRKEAAAPSRAEFAFGLDALARSGGLEAGGKRIELGTATGGSTKDKKRVLYLEAGFGGGQYYLTLRFVPAGGGR